MASNPQDVRQAALKEMARRELVRRQGQQPLRPGQSGAFSGPIATGEEMAESHAIAASRAQKPPGLLRRLGMIPVGLGEAGLSVLTGMASAPANDFVAGMAEAEPGGRDAQSVMTNPPVGTYEPRSGAGRAILGGLGKIMEPVGRLIDWSADVNNPDPEVRATGHLLRGTLGVVPGAAAVRRARTPARAVPSIADLKTSSQSAYAAAERAGAGQMVPQNELATFANKIQQNLATAGAREKLHPNTFVAFEEVMQEATAPGVAGSSFKGLETMRRVLQSAENSAKQGSDDARLAGQIVDDFDDFIDTQSPTVAGFSETARAMWSRMRKAETIQGLVERAKNSAPSLTQSGLENALRLEFKALANNERRFRRFSADEREAILRVVRGTVPQNVIRQVGRTLAVRGPVSGTVSLLGGNALGGPLGAAAAAGVGEASALAARLMRLRDVRRVDELVRGGPAPSRVPNSQPLDQLGYLPANALATRDAASNALYGDQERRRNALTR